MKPAFKAKDESYRVRLPKRVSFSKIEEVRRLDDEVSVTSTVQDQLFMGLNKLSAGASDGLNKLSAGASDVKQKVSDVLEKRSWSLSELPPIPSLPQIPSEMTQAEMNADADVLQKKSWSFSQLPDINVKFFKSKDEQAKVDADADVLQKKSWSFSQLPDIVCDKLRQNLPRTPSLHDCQDNPIRRGAMLLDYLSPRAHKVNTVFAVACDAGFGEEVRVIGNVAALGNWDPSGAVRMKWTDGNVWVTEVNLDLQPPKPLEYKYMIMSDGQVRTWETCINRVLLETQGASSLCFRDVWGVV